MCGIAGIIDLDGFDPQTLVAMTHLVTHRGPDGFGFTFCEPGPHAPVETIHNENRLPHLARPVIGLGNRRLAILDVTPLGNMPMVIEDGAYSITFNGEIYNYREIRRELEGLGYHFRTATDTEVILNAYREWGDECLQRFNGMWSFALWDRSRQRVFCARDRFGVKPFYYAVSNSSFFFGSEIRQIHLVSSMERRPNPNTVFAFLEWGLMDHSAETFFEGIHQLTPGHSLTLDLRSPFTPVIQCYWELRTEPEVSLNPEEATEEFQRLFKNAVRIRLRSDVPIGICLSGGLDSSTVLCQAKEIAPEIQFQTFSACFEEEAIDEREYIAAAVSATKSISHKAFPKGHAFWESIQAMALHHGEPLAGASTFSQWTVMETARRHGISVILGGQGGDESLCGYQKYQYFYFWHLLRRGDPKVVREIILWLRNGTTSPHGRLLAATRYLPAALRQPFSVAERIGTEEFRRALRDFKSGLGYTNSIAARQKIDLTYSSIPLLLRHEERNSMAHSVESRLPFLDYQLVEFAVRCPPSIKLRDGWSKWILRNAMKGTLPEKVRLRKTKLGFDAPVASWLRLGLQNGYRELWETPRLRMERFLNGPSVARECHKFIQGARTAFPADLLFKALSLELWARVHNVT
ncbi:MAG TPA: asparagine synthase (glutamine-hydrolyzing) [Candidatus Acidoferrum sp.]|nr:asparagine synthase (glutamine-hydrolyzing) [Candidatus Acidoferrum sp.]